MVPMTKISPRRGILLPRSRFVEGGCSLPFNVLTVGLLLGVLFSLNSVFLNARYTRDRDLSAVHLLDKPSRTLGDDIVQGMLNDDPTLVFLLSFPFSGAEETLETVQQITNASVATNYGHDIRKQQPQQQHKELVSVRPKELPNGPFLIDPDLSIPSNVLTSTHCGGHCAFCQPDESIITIADFEQQCGRVVPVSFQAYYYDAPNETIHDNYYSPYLAQRAVHLLRHPLDNILARMHGGRGLRSSAEQSSSGSRESNTLNSGAADLPTEFRSWCKLIDRGFRNFRAADYGLPEEIDEFLPQVPCHSDLIRYVQWHNRAVETVKLLNIPVHILYYEDYESSFTETMRDLLQFLSLPARIDSNFSAHNDISQRHLFTATETRAAARLMRAIATPECWTLLRPYVIPWLSTRHVASSPQLTVSFTPLSGETRAPPPPKLKALSENSTGKDHHIAWLMSFPNSGTSYTIANVMKMTNTTTASNYGVEAALRDGQLVPARGDSPYGPFLLDPDRDVPWLLLTKTHCTGYCDACKLLDHLRSREGFDTGCRETTVGNGPDLQTFLSRTWDPIKAVHLIRSPFDNLVSRMHLGVRHRFRDGILNASHAAIMSEDTKEALHAWCSYLDGLYEKRGDTKWFLTFTEQATSRFVKVPCYAEIFRWIHWHNMAIEVTDSLNIPVHYLYYEDYTTRFHEAVDGLNNFLKLPVVDDPLPFEAGKSYKHLFQPAELRTIAELARFLATPKCWYHIRRYFQGYYVPIDNKDNEADLYGAELGNPKIVLLISFPNSGTSYTISNVQNVTRTSAATNMVHETRTSDPVLARADMEYGPFLLEPHEGKPWRYILTKSHCTGFCDNCGQNATVKTLSTFEKACRTTTLQRNETLGMYNASAVQKIVHLFRNPYDNLVSRMHLGIIKRRKEGWPEERLSRFSDSKEGILLWCEHVDSAFGNQPDFFPEAARDFFTDVPCYAEVFRYIQWHNLALQMMDMYGVPSHTIFYDDYETNYDQTLGDLLSFLGLERTHDNKPFIAGKRYKSLFEPRHQHGIARLAHALATPECWVLVQPRYFPEWTARDHLGELEES